MLIEISVEIGYYNRCVSNVVFAQQKVSERERDTTGNLYLEEEQEFSFQSYVWMRCIDPA